jgi:hypothetical protein
LKEKIRKSDCNQFFFFSGKMPKKSIAVLIKKWNEIKVNKSRLSRARLNKNVHDEPNSLRAQIATNPYGI